MIMYFCMVHLCNQNYSHNSTKKMLFLPTEYQAISIVFRPGTCGSLKTETFIPNTTKPERTVIIFVNKEVV